MLRSERAVVDATAEWLYDRVMEERKVWYNDHGWTYVPPFRDLQEQDRDLWRDDADKVLAVIEKALR